jgi:glycine dehydrogenase subunit 2
MQLIFEKSKPGRRLTLLPDSDVAVILPKDQRKSKPRLPQISENDLSRHYTELMKRTFGVNDGFYPLGSCTMKYNPKIDEEIAALPGFSRIHPLQPQETAAGCMEVIELTEQYLCEITGMDAITLQPAAGAHGEFTGLMLMKAYHESKGDYKRNKIIVPDSAHGTNPASAVMAGFEVVSIGSGSDGCIDLDALKAVCDENLAGLMLTNPNTLGLFDKNILEITEIVHHSGGLCYYDGANLNAIIGIVRPGDMGFDCVHVNLHKTFATPHGGGGPGSGPVGCKEFLKQFLPAPTVKDGAFVNDHNSIGKVRSYFGNFLVYVRALTYILTLGGDGLPKVAETAVLNANYVMTKLSELFPAAYQCRCMHEFVMNLSEFKEKTGVSALDAAKGLIDLGIHPPTMYFPLIVHEALMLEPTETESKETLDQCVEAFRTIHEKAFHNPSELHDAPKHAAITRPDEVKAARTPILNYYLDKE